MIAYRGTDDSLIGWHEDFLMLCEKVVPGPESSVHFLAEIASQNITSSLMHDLKNKFLAPSIWQRLKKHFQYRQHRPLCLLGHPKRGH